MNNRQKMYKTNGLVRKYLISHDYKDVHLFPHTRHIKDLHFQGQEFDGIASKGLCLVLFQIKTNCRATKKTLQEYRALESKFGILCLWINRTKEGIEVNNKNV